MRQGRIDALGYDLEGALRAAEEAEHEADAMIRAQDEEIARLNARISRLRERCLRLVRACRDERMTSDAYARVILRMRGGGDAADRP